MIIDHYFLPLRVYDDGESDEDDEDDERTDVDLNAPFDPGWFWTKMKSTLNFLRGLELLRAQ